MFQRDIPSVLRPEQPLGTEPRYRLEIHIHGPPEAYIERRFLGGRW